MTTLYMDGFAQYGACTNSVVSPNPVASAMLAGPWAQVDIGGNGPITVGQAPYGMPTGAFSFGRTDTVNSFGMRRVIPQGAQTNQYVSFRYAVSSLPAVFSAPVCICDWRDNGNNVLYSLGCDTTGALQFYEGPFTTLVASSSGPVIVSQTFAFFEIQYNPGSTQVIIRVNDPAANLTPVITATISGTSVSQNGFLTTNRSFGSGTGITHYIADLFVRNGSGSVNNGFLGDRRVAWLPVVADSTPMGWLPNFYHQQGTGILDLSQQTGASVASPGATSLDLGSGDYTLESFVRFAALPNTSNYSTIFSRWDSANNRRSYRLSLGGTSFNGGALQFDYSTDGSASTVTTPIIYPWTPDLNTWYHIALVKASNELLLFVDGNQLGLPISDTSTYFGPGAEPLGIGAEMTSGPAVVANTSLSGWYDETRFTVGYARYNAPFAPPTSPFPRGSIADPEWADVSLLCGYDSAIQDESGFARGLTALDGAVQFTTNDGPLVGNFSTLGKSTPDDHTFMYAQFTSATGILTMTTQPSNGDTVTVGTTDGSTPAVYTFKTAISTAFDVLIDSTAENTLLNLYNAINAGTGAGTKYGTGTTANFDVSASQLPVGQIEVTALTAGTGGNSIASIATGSAASWGSSTLSGGASIPGPSDFKVQRPPANTTLISAVQLVQRMWKTDAGLATEQGALVGPLGNVSTGTAYNITTNPSVYSDIFEEDPDTSASITPATLINGKVQINRTV